MKKDKLRYITLVARLIVGVVLIYASLSKIPNSFYFSIQIENYRIVGRGIARMVAVTLPWIELVTGLCLIAGWWLRPASFIANGLFLLFIVGIISALVRGLDIECGCFGSGIHETVSFSLLLRDIVLFGFCMFIFLSTVNNKSKSNSSS